MEGSDLIQGEAGDDTILTGNGDDFIQGGAGDDKIDGGEEAIQQYLPVTRLITTLSE